MTTIARHATAVAPACCPPDLFGMAREQLREALAESLARTSAEMVRLAWIVRLLEERGEDLEGLKLDLLPYLRLIAYGQLSPELVVRFSHSGPIMKFARSLPMPDQDRLARGERVPMAVRKPDGSFDHQMADPALMSPRQVGQVFAVGRMRPIEEQILVLRDRPEKPARKKAEAVGRVMVTPVGDGIIVKGTFVPKADLVDALALMAGFRDESLDEENLVPRGVMVQLTDAQYDRLKSAADKGNTKMSPLVRRALAAYGLI